jgi:rubrerythrin
VEPTQDEPTECGECGYLWDCPECGHTFRESERGAEGRPPAVCPTCDAGIAEGYEADEEDEEFEWS